MTKHIAPDISPEYTVGDIGGTNARLELWSIEKCEKMNEKLLNQKKYASQEFNSMEEIIKQFLDDSKIDETPIVMALAVAGPVVDNTCQITNLSFNINGDDMQKELNIKKVVLLNDFSAVALGTLELEDDDVYVLNDQPASPKAAIACIGAGTGLGEAYLTHNGSEYDVWSSEGGHSDYAPRNYLEMELVMYVSDLIANKKWRAGSDKDVGVLETNPERCLHMHLPNEEKFSHHLGLQLGAKVIRVSAERIVSGTGFPHIYDFLKLHYPNEVNKEVTNEIEKGDKLPIEVIMDYASRKADKLCEKALEIFISAYGSEAGNLCLKLLPYGGLYVAGGIAPRIIKNLKENNMFVRHMTSKGRMSNLLEKIPVYVIKQEVEVGLLGSRLLAKRLLRSVVNLKFNENNIKCPDAPKNRRNKKRKK